MAKILVIRGGAIGDFVVTLPAIGLLREAFPDVEVDILGYPSIIALAENRYYARRTRGIEYAGMAKFFIPGGELPEDLVAYFSQYQQVISYIFDPDQFFANNLKEAGVKNLISASPKILDEEHAAYQLARPLQSLALYLEEPGAKLFPRKEDFQEAVRLISGNEEPYMAIHPGSGGEKKNWPLESWVEWVKGWGLRYGKQYRLLVVGGEADAERIKVLEAVLGETGVRFQVLRSVPLPLLAAILARGTAFLGHDSGISHIAAASGVPSVLMFGPTNPDVWAPQNKNVRVLSHPSGQVRFTVKQVDAALEEFL